jgi:hypothetical protein
MFRIQTTNSCRISSQQPWRRAFFFLPLCLLLLTTALAQNSKPLTNDDIQQMIKERFSEETIIKAIEANPSGFDVSLPGLRALREAGVSDKIIQAMLAASRRRADTDEKPAAPKGLPAEMGVYRKEGEKLIEVQPEIVNWRTGGVFKMAITSGISGGHVNGTVQNPRSPLQTGLPLEFIIRCPEGTSAAEYQLLRLEQKKDRREFRAATMGALRASGGADKNATPFLFEKIAPATFRIKLTELKKGEYGFLPPGVGSASLAASGKIYTFGIE